MMNRKYRIPFFAEAIIDYNSKYYMAANMLNASNFQKYLQNAYDLISHIIKPF